MKYIKEKEEKSVGSYLQFRQEENLKKKKKKEKKFGLDKNDELVAGSGNLVSEFYNEG